MGAGAVTTFWDSSPTAYYRTNLQYNSVNAYVDHEKPSNYGFGSIVDTLMTLHTPGADLFKQVRTGKP